MGYKIEFDDKIDILPIKAFIESVDEPQYCWSKYISIIFVLNGKIQILSNKDKNTLNQNDIFLINSYIPFSVESLSLNQTIVLQIDPEYFNDYYSNFSKLKFKIDPYFCTEDDLEYLRNLVVQIVETIYMKREGYIIKTQQLLFELIYLLINKYVDRNLSDNQTFIGEENRLKSIAEYIETHYKENISLNDIAGHVHLNPQYTSRYFSKNTGITLNNYIASVRLQKSLKDLITCDKKISNIALDNGFPNIKSYFKVFKRSYNLTPMEYRKLHWNKTEGDNPKGHFTSHDKKDLLKKLFEYNNVNRIQKNILPQVKEKYSIDYNKPKGKLHKTWQTVIGFGRAAEGLRAEWRNQLRELQKDIPFKYIRFHGILSDEMMVYSEDGNGNACYNFSYVDELIDFLMEINIKPFIELSYMPEQLASKKEYLFMWKANISCPKSLDKWSLLIENLIRHLVLRYGINEVRTWYFELWNEYDFKLDFKIDYQNKCFEFFKSTFTAIKRVDPELQVGGLNLLDSLIFDSNIVDSFNSFCKKENIVLDFVSFRIYSIAFKENTLPEDKFLENIIKVSNEQYIPQNILKFCRYGDEDQITNNISKVVKKLENYDFFKNKIFINEWNTVPDPRDLIHDTCYKAPFLVKNILDNYDKVDGAAYWAFTDIFEEIKTGSSTFHGGLGLITTNGLKKPAYHAYQMLNKLGDTILEKGDDYIVTMKDDGSFQILVYNYCHFDNPITQCNTPKVTMYDRYSIFKEKLKEVHFTVKGFEGRAVQNTYRINREKGSIFDQWLKMGAPGTLKTEELKYLEMNSTYMYSTKNINIDNDYTIKEKLLPHEVLFIEVLPVK